jgi:hypothetical protein
MAASWAGEVLASIGDRRNDGGGRAAAVAAQFIAMVVGDVFDFL